MQRSTSPSTRPHPLQMIRLQYFIYFGVLGIYLPYFNLYCYHIGLSGTQIGSLSAARSLVLVIFPLLWATLADRFHSRRRLYVLCSMCAAFTWCLYLTTSAFLPMFAITVAHGIFFAPLISFLEAFSMDLLGRARQRYGNIRAWGSVNFILVVLLLGRLIDIFDIRLILLLILAGSVVQSIAAMRLPLDAGPKTTPLPGRPATLMRLQSVVFLFCGFLMLASHGAYYGFFSIHLKTLGFSSSFIGISWALASVVEILVMITSGGIFRRFSLDRVLVFSFGAAAFRWMVLYFAHSPWLILLTQPLHAFTYAAFHMASILYIDRLTSERNKTFGQAVNNAVQYGLGLMVGFFLNGYLYGRIGSFALFAVSSLLALAGGLIFGGFTLHLRRTGRRSEIESSARYQDG
ncbi:MAG: MFS transporter [Deltaproteobacteria bacterium SG8_13]|nr:MAG: MFS transporter [Deltaproteobacteria bacterium SG8_13]